MPISEISQIEMPEWLSLGDFDFDVKRILQDSLYYPASGLDGNPVKYFMGNVFSFLYVDYGISRETFLAELHYRGFYGYRIIHQQSISQFQLAPNGHTVFVPLPDILQNPLYQSWIEPPFCEWVVFQRREGFGPEHNPERFSLIYLCAEGVAAFQAIYLSNKIKPRIVAIIQPGHSFGGNWTNFTRRTEFFARSVLYDRDLWPEYLVNGGWGPPRFYQDPIWPEYSKRVRQIMPRIEGCGGSDRVTTLVWQLSA